MAENIEYYRNQVAVARTEIKNLRQQLAALKHEHQKQIQLIKLTLEGLQCSNCANTASPVNNVNEQVSASEDKIISYKPIGVIETPFQNKRGVPRQPSVLAEANASVIIDQNVFNNPEHALSGLEEFSHMWIIFHFHATESNNTPAKVAPPRLGGERRGVFSTRSPHRPCPIGLSLVKIVTVQGNRINFQGVDMINGTPVLDIKPYIPQYDYPRLALANDEVAELVRPQTEGVSDAIETMTNNVHLGENPSNPGSITNSIGIETSNLNRSLDADSQSNITTPICPSPDSPLSVDLLDGRSPARRPDSERGAPDGQERFTPPQSAHITNLNQDGIRVAPWISNPPNQTYEVYFLDDALARLIELIGDRAQAFRRNIEGLLSEDPRSHYVRTRYPEHEYSCVLEDLSISCIFDSESLTCTIIAVRSAEELQQIDTE